MRKDLWVSLIVTRFIIIQIYTCWSDHVQLIIFRYTFYRYISSQWSTKTSAPLPLRLRNESWHLFNIVFFDQILVNIFHIANINSMINDTQIVYIPLSPAFFMFSTASSFNSKSFEIFPKYYGHDFISEYFALNWWIFTPLGYKKLLATL